jgi:hypothetical protein
MSNYEGFKSRRTSVSFGTTMTEAMRKGDFSAVTTALQDPLTRVRSGNTWLLFREQHKTLSPMFDEVRSHNGPEGDLFTWVLSHLSKSPIPGGRPFDDVVPGGNITDFQDRWDWITTDMMPTYQQLLRDNPQLAQQLIDTPVAERAQLIRNLGFLGS